MSESAETGRVEIEGVEEGFSTETLTRDGLLLLLQKDSQVREVIAAIAQPVDQPALSATPATTDINETLRTELSFVLRLLTLVEQHEDLKSHLLSNSDYEGDKLVRLLVNLGRWDLIEMIWDTLAADVKQRGASATANELELLDGCLQCFNLTSITHKATLHSLEVPQAFNHKVHNRLNAKGKVVIDVALPGLVNTAGKCVKKVLVITE